MPCCEEVLVALLLNYPAPVSLTDLSLGLNLDNDAVIIHLKTLEACELVKKVDSAWVISDEKVPRVMKFVETLWFNEEAISKGKNQGTMEAGADEP